MNSKTVEKSLRFIDSWLDFKYRISEYSGFVVAISFKGKIVFNKAYGYANLESKEKLTPGHIFRVASHSKTFTATVIMQLVEKKKLKLDDVVVKYLPWLRKHKDKRFLKITIIDLLSHGAGVIRDGLDSDYWNLARPFPNKDQFEKVILEADLVFNINTRLKYSNFGYTLLGLVVEAVTGERYNDYVKTNIIIPFGLKNTGPEYEKSEKKFVTGYSRRDHKKARHPFENIDTKAMSSATGFYSTSEDLCKYFTAQIAGSGKLLSDESKKEMQKTKWKVKNIRENEGYGLGFVITKVKKKIFFGHSGGFPGQSTDTMCEAQNEIVVTALTNCIDGWAKTITKGVISVIAEYEKKDSVSNLSRFEGRFINAWSILDLLAIGDNVYAVDPSTWEPFDGAEKLKYIDDFTLKIVKANSYSSEGELVHFNFDKNRKIKSVIYAGATMLPERRYALRKRTLT